MNLPAFHANASLYRLSGHTYITHSDSQTEVSAIPAQFGWLDAVQSNGCSPGWERDCVTQCREVDICRGWWFGLEGTEDGCFDKRKYWICEKFPDCRCKPKFAVFETGHPVAFRSR
jgi:hypothetical protein